MQGNCGSSPVLREGEPMRKTIIYRPWQPGDDAVLALLLNTLNTYEAWYRQKFDDPAVENFEPEGIHLALINERVVGQAMGLPISLFIEERVQEFGEVSDVFVAPDIRRQGIATHLMQEMHAYFEGKGYRGSILVTDTEEARRLYQKVGYREVTRVLQTRLLPNPDVSQLRWTSTCVEDLRVLHQLDWRWTRQNFRVWWAPGSVKVDQSNLDEYHVLRCRGDIVGYAEWSEPSERYPDGLICDPIVPDVDPTEVIKSIQAVIPTPLAWETCAGSRYENPLCLVGCSLEQTLDVTMLLFFGQQIDLTKQFRTFS